ncbi:hypothetical protein [Eubacterium aggregans]|uniref:hypothetical protein n=1 Tax=Eubacterium aggregans TaxID=81409 RepID=UPI003F3F46A5
MNEIRKLCQMRLAVSSVDQAGVAELFKLGIDFFDNVLEEYTHRRDIVAECLAEMDGVVGKVPTGAFYYMVKLPVKDACDFIEWLITDFEYQGETVLLSPANDFYIHPEDGVDEVRLAYGLGEKDLRKAMKALEEGLIAYKATYPQCCNIEGDRNEDQKIKKRGQCPGLFIHKKPTGENRRQWEPLF